MALGEFPLLRWMKTTRWDMLTYKDNILPPFIKVEEDIRFLCPKSQQDRKRPPGLACPPVGQGVYLGRMHHSGVTPHQVRSRSTYVWKFSWGMRDFSPLLTSPHSAPVSLPLSHEAPYGSITDISTLIWDPFALC